MYTPQQPRFAPQNQVYAAPAPIVRDDVYVDRGLFSSTREEVRVDAYGNVTDVEVTKDIFGNTETETITTDRFGNRREVDSQTDMFGDRSTEIVDQNAYGAVTNVQEYSNTW